MVFFRKKLMQVDMETGDVQEGITVLIPQKAKLKDSFMLIMQEAALRLAKDKNITTEEHRVFWFLVGSTDYENYVRISQVDIAKELGMRKQNVNRAIKKLADRKMLVEAGKEGRSKVYRLNAFYGWKGKVSKEYQDAFEEHVKLIS